MKKILLFSLLAVIILSACKTAQAPKLDADSILDDQIFSQATKNNDIKQCDEIKNTAQQQDCLAVIQADLAITKATDNNDPKLCDEIKLERYKKNCIDSVNIKLKNENESKQFQDFVKQQNDLSTKLSANNDIDGCKTLDPSLIEECENNIYSKIALEQNKPEYCDKITQSSLKVNCKSLLAK